MTTKRSPERAQFLADILTTAVEGGINYWASVNGYHWYDPGMPGGTADPGPDGTANAYVTVYEDEDEGATPHRVTLDTIATGLSRLRDMVKREQLGSHPSLQQALLADRTNGEDGDYDAGVADMIVQLGIFGEVVYG